MTTLDHPVHYCSKCGQRINRKTRDKKTREVYPCGNCDYEGRTLGALDAHLNAWHPSGGEAE